MTRSFLSAYCGCLQAQYATFGAVMPCFLFASFGTRPELSSDCVKSEENRRNLIRCLQNKESVIACYAMRRRLGLRISSNAAEKASDLTVAKRQKHRGMSWSYHGSWHFAALTALCLNQEADVRHKTGSLSFKMIPVSIPKSETSAPAAA